MSHPGSVCAGNATAVAASSRYAAPPLRSGPSGDTATAVAKWLIMTGRVLPVITDRHLTSAPTEDPTIPLTSSRAMGNVRSSRAKNQSEYTLSLPLDCPTNQDHLSTMLGESAKKFDPVTPMTNSNLVEVLQAQSQSRVGLLSHGKLVQGKKAADQTLDEQVARGNNLFVVDAVDDTDVTSIAELTEDWPLTTGADALPMFLARTWLTNLDNIEQRTLLPASPGHEAVIAGSCANATLRQVAHFEKHYPVFRFDLLQAVSNPRIIDSFRDWAANRIKEGPVAVTTSADIDGVQRAQQTLGIEGAANLADELLGQSARALQELGVRKFVVAGGETSGQVINSLGINQVQVSSFDNLSGGYCHMAGPDPHSFVLKAGALGNESFFFTALNRMRAADEAA